MLDSVNGGRYSVMIDVRLCYGGWMELIGWVEGVS